MCSTSAKEYLSHIQTPLGMRSVYNSVCHCNRCGMCAQVCPSYLQTQQELFSPRGRNQTLRLLLEGKLKAKKIAPQLQTMIETCSLCNRCTQACPGQIPTPQHVLELRRRLHKQLLPATLFYMLRFYQKAPKVFDALVHLFLLLRKTGIMSLVAWIPSFAWVGYADKILPRKRVHKIRPQQPQKKTTLIYLPSFEAQFLMPQLFNQSYQLACRKNKTLVWKYKSSGLFEYTYGDLRRARKLVKKLIRLHAHTANGKLPLLTDSMEVYLFLKQSTQLFEIYPAWKKKAQHFASCVRFITDIFPKKIAPVPQVQLPVSLCTISTSEVQENPQAQAQQILRSLFKKNFVQCDYKDGIVPLLGYGFIKNTHAPDYLLQAVRAVATHQIKTVFVTSAIATLELGFYMHMFYPCAKVCHIAELNG